MQEMNVAFGGSLHPEIRELPGRMNHRMPRLANGEIHPDPTVVFADRHDVELVPGGTFARLFGAERIRVNSLHGQGIQEPGHASWSKVSPRTAPSRPIRIADAKGSHWVSSAGMGEYSSVFEPDSIGRCPPLL